MNNQAIDHLLQESVEDSLCNLLFCMKRNGKLYRVLRTLWGMAEIDSPVTLDYLSRISNITPPVLRRLMSGLQYAGFVHSPEELRGFWLLASPLSEVTFRDVYESFGLHSPLNSRYCSANLGCWVEATDNASVKSPLHDEEIVTVTINLEATLDDIGFVA